MAAIAIVDRSEFPAHLLVPAMAIRAKSVEHAIDASGLGHRDTLVAGQAVLAAGPVDEIVMATCTCQSDVVGMQESGMVDRRLSQAGQPGLGH